jgi:predicted transposase/invertase (TIGR01784 family)
MTEQRDEFDSPWKDILEAYFQDFVHLRTKATREDSQLRKEWKFRLTRKLYEQGYKRQDILNLFRFIDWMMELPDGLKQIFRAELEQYEQERHMPYVTSIEQLARAEAKEEERLATQKTIALNMLQDNLPLEQISRLTGLTIAQLQQLQSSQKQE